MPKSQHGGSRQPELFPRSKRPTVPVEENHRLVQLADRLDWTEMDRRQRRLGASLVVEPAAVERAARRVAREEAADGLPVSNASATLV